jgi:hypothetical protein
MPFSPPSGCVYPTLRMDLVVHSSHYHYHRVWVFEVYWRVSPPPPPTVIAMPQLFWPGFVLCYPGSSCPHHISIVPHPRLGRWLERLHRLTLTLSNCLRPSYHQDLHNSCMWLHSLCQMPPTKVLCVTIHIWFASAHPIYLTVEASSKTTSKDHSNHHCVGPFAPTWRCLATSTPIIPMKPAFITWHARSSLIHLVYLLYFPCVVDIWSCLTMMFSTPFL